MIALAVVAVIAYLACGIVAARWAHRHYRLPDNGMAGCFVLIWPPVTAFLVIGSLVEILGRVVRR